MKYLILAVLALSLGACGKIDREIAAWSGDAAKTCVDGVTYLQFTSGATVQLDINGKPVGCR